MTAAPTARIRLLRLAGSTTLVTATVFEELFAQHLGAEFDVAFASLDAWCRQVFGGGAAPTMSRDTIRAFDTATRDVEFLCPSFEAVALLPLFAELRNAASSRTALLVIAHSPAVWPLEWALLSGLLRAGDRIVTPSQSAADAITALSPALAPFVRVIPHPVHGALGARDGLPARAATRPRIVSLGRITPTKLLHRQLDALAQLRAGSRTAPVLEIAGETTDASGATLPYVRSLHRRAERLGISAQVRLVGVLRGDAARNDFLSGACALSNLSVTLEESFGKAPAEALAVGIPALVTAWNGLPETVGAGGHLVPVTIVGDGLETVDVTTGDLATALDRMLTAPPTADACRAAAARFAPRLVRAAYRQVLSEALDERMRVPTDTVASVPLDDDPAVRAGLLAACPMDQFTWHELLALYHRSAADSVHRAIGAEHDPHHAASAPTTDADRLRRLLLVSTRVGLEHRYAGLPAETYVESGVPPRCAPSQRTLTERLAEGARGSGPWRARVACLVELLTIDTSTAHDALRSGLAQLEVEGIDNVATRFLRVATADASGESTSALDLASDDLALLPPGELGAARLHQVSRIARRAGTAERAVSPLRDWLAPHPDAPESGGVWLELALLLAERDSGAAEAALVQAQALLGNVPPVLAIQRRIARAVATMCLQPSTARVPGADA